MRIRPANIADLERIYILLTDAGLMRDGVSDCVETIRVAVDHDEMVQGAVALEPYGDLALLRSLVVSRTHRSSGMGGSLLAAADDLARRYGFATVYLLTTDAAGYFAKQGWTQIERSIVPEQIRASPQFSLLCPDSAIVMCRVQSDA